MISKRPSSCSTTAVQLSTQSPQLMADAEVFMNHGMMNVAANDAVDAMALRFGGERLFECADVVHSVFDLVLRPLRQRPIAETKAAPYDIEISIYQDR